VPGSSIWTHLNGYNNLDASKPPLTSTQVSPNVTDNVYAAPVKSTWLDRIFSSKTSTAVKAAAVATESASASVTSSAPKVKTAGQRRADVITPRAARHAKADPS
jgi:hypothetical protein